MSEKIVRILNKVVGIIISLDFFSTLLAGITIIITLISYFSQNTGIEEFIFNNKHLISCLLIVLLMLYTTFITRLFLRIRAFRNIYVSYSHVDKELADFIIYYISQSSRIKGRRMVVKSDNDIKIGENIAQRTKYDISNAGTVIIVVSQAYLESKSCNDEYSYIIKERPRIIPVFLSSVQDLSELPKSMQNNKGIFLKQDSKDEMRLQLDAVIKDIIE